MSDVLPHVAAARRRTAALCPRLVVGDEWRMDGAALVIVRLESLKEEGYPWPLVHYTRAGKPGECHTGAPAFVFGELVSRGAGEPWEPAPGEAEPF